ncbi:hypothetical protein GCM10010872_06390 [Dyella flava]|nr:hypothetical protein GCM10010872_06390 [Dyella flava]
MVWQRGAEIPDEIDAIESYEPFRATKPEEPVWCLRDLVDIGGGPLLGGEKRVGKVD